MNDEKHALAAARAAVRDLSTVGEGSGGARLLALALLATASPASAQAKPPVKPTLPAAVARAFHDAYPAATILAWSRERENGRTVYEVESRDGTTRRDLLHSTTGTTIEIEEAVPAAALPAAVQAAVQAAAPGAVITRAERVTRDSVDTWEISFTAGGKARSLAVDPAGRPVKP